MKKNKKLITVSKYVKYLLRGFALVSILVLLSLYFVVKAINIHFDLFICMIYPCGICFLYLVYQFIKLFDTLSNNKPFCYENVVRLKNSMVTCFVISILVLISLLISIFYTYYSLQLRVSIIFISVLFFGVSISLYVLSELFNQAVDYKEENDLTI